MRKGHLIKLCINTYSKYAFMSFCVTVLGAALVVYDSIYSMLILSLLIFAAWCMGEILTRHIFKNVNSGWISFALGLGGIGCINYYIFEFGIGGKSVILIVLLLPILVQIRKIKQADVKSKIHSLVVKINNNKIYMIFMCFLMIMYIALAASPIDGADAGTKHLPITIYASENGQWYHNLIENTVAYSESTLLPYCYSVIFALFGEIKGFVLFNVFLFWAIHNILIEFLRKLCPSMRKEIFSAVFLTTPLFMLLGTTYMVDCLPAFWVVVLLLILVCTDYKGIMKVLPVNCTPCQGHF